MGWIGVDLDGTLAAYPGSCPGHELVGPPLEPMLRRVKQWIADGKDVRIFTARSGDPRFEEAIRAWLREFVGADLPITNVKDYKMVELWDDRAVQMVPNTGSPLDISRA